MKTLPILFLSMAFYKNALGAVPSFTNPAPGSESVSIPEGVSGRTIYNVTATDSEKGAITYSLVSQPQGNSVPFAVATNGLVTTSAEIDYETIKSKIFTLEIIATSDHDAADTATATLTVTVTDVNDNTPIFSSPTFCIAVPSNASQGSSVGQYTAKDNDKTVANNAVSNYAVTSGDDTPAKFTLDSTTGILTTTGEAFNKTAKAIYSLVIVASDGATTGPKTGTTTVKITLDGDGSCPSNTQLDKQDNRNNGITTGATALIGIITVFLRVI